MNAEITCSRHREPHSIREGCPDFQTCDRQTGAVECLARLRDSASL